MNAYECVETCIEEDDRRAEEGAIISEFNALQEKEKEEQHKKEKIRKATVLVEEVFNKLVDYGQGEFVPTSITIETDKLEIKITSK